MRREDIILETSLKRLLEAYAEHCRRNGLLESSVQLCRKLALRFLKGLEDAGVTEAAGIGLHEVFRACGKATTICLQSIYFYSNTTNLDSSDVGVTCSNAAPAFEKKKSILHEMAKFMKFIKIFVVFT